MATSNSKLFGFKLPAVSKDDKSKAVVSPIPSNEEDKSDFYISSGFYGQYVDIEGVYKNEQDLVRRYREMCLHPECDSAIEDVVNEAIVSDLDDSPVEVELSNLDASDKLKEIIRTEFKHIKKLLGFDRKCHEIFRTWYIDGRVYYHKVIDLKKPQEGIQEVRYIDPLKIRLIRKQERLGPNYESPIVTDKQTDLTQYETPKIEEYAKRGNPDKFILPKPIINKGGCNLSFAGLKTAVLKISKKIKTQEEKFDLAASFQKTIEEILYKKSKIAFKEFRKINENSNKFVVAGGVAANKGIRKVLENLCNKENFEPIFTPTNLCGDNAAMIAMVGLEKFKKKQFNNLDYPVKPRWVLDEKAVFLKGAGVKL